MTNQGGRVLTLLDQLIFFGLIAVIGLTAIPYGTSESWSKALFESAVFFLAFLWIVHGLFDGSWRIGNTSLIMPMVGLFVLAVVQSLAWWQVNTAGDKVWAALSSDPFETRIFAFRIAALILVLVLVDRFTWSAKRLGILVHAIIAVALASALFGIARQATQPGSFALTPAFILARLTPAHGYAQFTNKNHFPFLMEMAVGLVVGIALMQRGRLDRLLLYLSVAGLMCAAVMLSRSRGGLLAITVQIIFAGILVVNSKSATGRHRYLGRWVRWARSIAVTAVIASALVVIIVSGVAWLGGDQLSTGLETATSEMSAVNTTEEQIGSRRRDIWRAAWSMFKAHPIAGAGLGAFWAEVPVFHDASGASTPQQAHNDYLELLASGGILGAAIFIWFAVALIMEARRSIRLGEGFQRAVSIGAVIGLAGVAVHSIVDFGLHITINALVLVLLLGVISLRSVGRQTVPMKSAP